MQSGFHVQCWIQLILQLDSASSNFRRTPKAAKLPDVVTQRKTHVKAQTPAKAASSEMEEGVRNKGSEVTVEALHC